MPHPAGFVSRGFEDSSLFDPGCSPEPRIWVEVGGKGGTGVLYCCGLPASRTRPKELTVEKIPVPLVADKAFSEFEKLLQKGRDLVARATMVGRFFSGKKQKFPNGNELWIGYGHMGFYSLFAIQQVVSVDPHDIPGLDYGASVEQPNFDREGCDSYRILIREEVFTKSIDQQKKAESGERAWSLDDPKRVAEEELAKYVEGKEFDLTETLKKEGRIIYHWRPGGKTEVKYMIVVNRPYWLSFYAKDPVKTAWVAAAAYSVCG